MDKIKHTGATLFFLFSGMLVWAQSDEKIQAALELANEKFYLKLFVALACLGGIIALGILAVGNAIGTLAQAGYLKERIKQKITDNKVPVILACITLASLGGSAVYAQEVGGTGSGYYFHFGPFEVYFMLVLDLILLGVFLYFRKVLMDLADMASPATAKVKTDARDVALSLNQALTGAVAIEEEDSILMDHEYDGIRELDNDLPPWWKWGFYLTIVIAVMYLFNYHFFGYGDLQEEAYAKEMIRAEEAKAAYLAKAAMNVDERTATFLGDAKSLSSGSKLFNQYCISCHREDGGGLVGPNLTDDYWLYDGDVKGIFSTIKYGATRGMKSWKDDFNPLQIQEIASYVKSLNGTNPPDPLAPEGVLFNDTTQVHE